MKKEQYILVADSSFAKIFKAGKQLDDISLVHTIENPEGRKQNRELDSDDGGMRAVMQANTHGAGDDSDSHGHDVEMFAKELCDLLRKEHLDGKFNSLQIAAGPQLLGMLRQNLSDDCQKVLSKTVNKNLIHAGEKDIAAHFG